MKAVDEKSAFFPEEFEKEIGYTFKIKTLEEALTHSSYANEGKTFA